MSRWFRNCSHQSIWCVKGSRINTYNTENELQKPWPWCKGCLVSLSLHDICQNKIKNLIFVIYTFCTQQVISQNCLLCWTPVRYPVTPLTWTLYWNVIAEWPGEGEKKKKCVGCSSLTSCYIQWVMLHPLIVHFQLPFISHLHIKSPAWLTLNWTEQVKFLQYILQSPPHLSS